MHHGKRCNEVGKREMLAADFNVQLERQHRASGRGKGRTCSQTGLTFGVGVDEHESKRRVVSKC